VIWGDPAFKIRTVIDQLGITQAEASHRAGITQSRMKAKI
jgi:predicted XRE-type DNA-binding protein